MISDLLNKICGKIAVIKGFSRTPETTMIIYSNFDKILGYLREFPRFSSRYLWATSKIVDEGDENVIWGLIDDIWYWHHTKTSPHDPAANVIPYSHSKSNNNKQKFTEEYLRVSTSLKNPTSPTCIP